MPGPAAFFCNQDIFLLVGMKRGAFGLDGDDIHALRNIPVVHSDFSCGKFAGFLPADRTEPRSDFSLRPFLARQAVAAVFPGCGQADKGFMVLGTVLILTQMVQQAELQLLVRDRPVQIIKNGAQPFRSQAGKG